jgi:hypothetical protein
MSEKPDEIEFVPWWGEFSIGEDEERFWQIGPLKLWLRRSAEEWRMTCERTDDPLDASLVVAGLPPRAPHPQSPAIRFGFRRTNEMIELVPVLADRAVIVNPATPFVVPSGEEVTLFVSSPLWFRVLVANHEVHEGAIYQPSDTWFGPSTRVGELCYASRTAARLHSEDLAVRPQRALSAVRIRNRAKSNLPFERLKLPARNLSLFASSGGRLWTEAVTLERREVGELVAIRLDKAPPSEAGAAAKVSGPRERVEKGSLMRAFGTLFAREDELR